MVLSTFLIFLVQADEIVEGVGGTYKLSELRIEMFEVFRPVAGCG